MCVFVWVHVCVWEGWVCTFMCVALEAWEQPFLFFLRSSPRCFLRWCLSLAWSLSNRLGWLVSNLQGYACLLPMPELQAYFNIPLFLKKQKRVLGIEFRASGLHGKHFTHGTVPNREHFITSVSSLLPFPFHHRPKLLQTASALWPGAHRTPCCHLPIMLTLLLCILSCFLLVPSFVRVMVDPTSFPLRPLLWTASLITTVFHSD